MTDVSRPLAPGDLLTVEQAIELLPVARSLLYALISEGQIPAIRVGCAGSRRGRWLVSRRGLEEYVERRLAAMEPRELKADPDAILTRIRRTRRGA